MNKKWLFGVIALVIIIVAATCAWYFIYQQPKPTQPQGPMTGTIKIAVLGPMATRQGKDMWTTAQMRADRINQQGGIKVGNMTYFIELIQKDTNELVDVTQAASAAEEAILVDGAQFLIGGLRADAIRIIREKAMDYKVMYFSDGYITWADMIQSFIGNYNRYKYWFSLAGPSNYSRTAEVYYGLVRFVANKVQSVANLTKVKVAILYEKTTDDTVFNYIKGNLSVTPNIEIVGIWRPSPYATDLRTELMGIQASGAHLLFAIFSGPAGTVLGVQCQELNLPLIICGSPGSITEQAAVPYQIVMMGINSYATFTEEQEAWYKEYKQRTGYEGPVATADFEILAQAISFARTLDYDAIINVLETHTFETTFGSYKFQDHCASISPGWNPYHAEQWVPGGRNIVWKDPYSSWNVPYEIKDIVFPTWIVEHWKQG